MTASDRGQPVEVNIGECLCPGTPHQSDLVYLRAEPDLAMGLAAMAALRQSGSLRGDADGALLSVEIRYGVIGWNLLDEKGEPAYLSTDAVARRLNWTEGAIAVAQKARELYEDKLISPLAPKQSESSPPTPSNGSTSPNPPSGPSSPTSSEPPLPSLQEVGT